MGPETPGSEARLLDVAGQLAGMVLKKAANPETGEVRVEDYLTMLAAATGEAILVDSGVVDIEANTMGPGGVVLGAPINVILSGDMGSFADVPPDSAAGILVARLVPGFVTLEAFGSMETLIKGTLDRIGDAPWGFVATTVPEPNRPTVMPLREAFELRGLAAAAQEMLGLPSGQRHRVCAHALASALEETGSAIDPAVAVTLSLEVMFAMAKRVPVPKSAFSQEQ